MQTCLTWPPPPLLCQYFSAFLTSPLSVFTCCFCVTTDCIMFGILSWRFWRRTDAWLAERWLRSGRVFSYIRFFVFTLVFSLITLLKHLSPGFGALEITTITKLKMNWSEKFWQYVLSQRMTFCSLRVRSFGVTWVILDHWSRLRIHWLSGCTNGNRFF